MTRLMAAGGVCATILGMVLLVSSTLYADGMCANQQIDTGANPTTSLCFSGQLVICSQQGVTCNGVAGTNTPGTYITSTSVSKCSKVTQTQQVCYASGTCIFVEGACVLNAVTSVNVSTGQSANARCNPPC
jgi:hypothetical protein